MCHICSRFFLLSPSAHLLTRDTANDLHYSNNCCNVWPSVADAVPNIAGILGQRLVTPQGKNVWKLLLSCYTLHSLYKYLGPRLHLFHHKLRVHDQATRTKSYKDAGVRALVTHWEVKYNVIMKTAFIRLAILRDNWFRWKMHPLESCVSQPRPTTSSEGAYLFNMRPNICKS